MKYKVGDKVRVEFRDCSINCIIDTEIILVDDTYYTVLYDRGWLIDDGRISYDPELKDFKGLHGWCILEEDIIEVYKTQKKAQTKCKKCNDYYEYGQANQEDGSFMCWGCRNGY